MASAEKNNPGTKKSEWRHATTGSSDVLRLRIKTT